MSANQLALAIRVPANRVTANLRGDRAVSAETALRLERYFGTGPEFWMNLQSRYDVSVVVSERGENTVSVSQRLKLALSMNCLNSSVSSCITANRVCTALMPDRLLSTYLVCSGGLS